MVERLNVGSGVTQPLLVVGSIAFDDVLTPTRTVCRQLGGAAAYASIAASYFTEVRLVGVVGEDFSEGDMQRFTDRGIDVSAVDRVPGETFYWKGMYHEDFKARETLELELNVYEGFRPHYIKNFSDTQYVMLGNIDPELQLHMYEGLADGVFVMGDTIDFWIKNKRRPLLKLLKNVDLLLIDASEARMLVEESNLFVAGARLRELGPSSVILKKGEHGAILFNEEGVFTVPAYPVVSFNDPTGAGDAFAGGLMGYLAATNDTSYRSIKRAMIYGTATASLCIEDFSSTRLEKAGCAVIQERYSALLDMMRL